jgi:hypothetical protein
MDIRQKINQLPWSLILSLGIFALIRPVIKVLGDVFSYSVSPLATAIITIAIAITWIGAIVRLKIKKPIIVLGLSGIVYAVLSTVMAVTIQLLVPDLGDEEAKISTLLTAGLVATTIFNFMYGAFLGFVATLIQRAINK